MLAVATPPRGPGTHLVSDITHIPTREGLPYLVAVLDLFSRCILGWKLVETMETGFGTAAFRRAFETRLVARQAIFHSDRRSQHSSGPTRRLLTP